MSVLFHVSPSLSSYRCSCRKSLKMETPGPNSPNDLLLLRNRKQNTISSQRKVSRQFEPLLLLEALKRVSQTCSTPDADEPMSSSTTGSRRAFVDGIASLCASERFSKTVTAAALAKTPNGLVLWLATNGGISRPALVFLEAMLQDLHHAAAQEASIGRQTMAAQITPTLLRQAVTFGASRLQLFGVQYHLAVSGCECPDQETMVIDAGDLGSKSLDIDG